MNTSGKTISNVFQRKIEDLDKGQELLVSSGIEEAAKLSRSIQSYLFLILGIFSVLVGLMLSVSAESFDF